MKYLFAALFLISSLLTRAQDYWDFGLSVGGGVNYHSYNNTSLNTLFDSYNAKFSSTLKNKITNLSPTLGYTINAEFKIATIFRVGFIRNFIRSQAIAEFNNGEKRIFDLEMPEIDWYFDIMSPKEKKVKFGFAISNHYQRARLFSSYQFMNGEVSYVRGNDAPDISGVYRAMSDNKIGIGIRMDIALKRKLFFSTRVEYVGLGYSSGLLPHRDEMHANILSGNVYADGVLPLYLPSDINNAGNTFYTSNGLGEDIFGAFVGFRIQATLNFILFNKSVES
jgi:hypothetical protein